MGSGDIEDWAAIRDWLDAHGKFFALSDGKRVPAGRKWAVLSVADLGELHLRSGELGACDPFVFLEGCESWVTLEPGNYPVKLTLADLSSDADGSDMVEAYVTLLVDPHAEEVWQKVLPGGIGVDAGAVCFVDAEAAQECLDDLDDWDGVEKLYDPNHLGPGRANLLLPGLDDGSNIVFCRSGWGDGFYSVVLGYDVENRLIRVHIDLGVVCGFPHDESVRLPTRPTPTERSKGLTALFMTLGSFLIFAFGIWQKWPVEHIIGAVLVWTALAMGAAAYKGWIRL
jgi:hypothetical protein